MNLVNITPVMTSNTTPSPYVVTASSIYSSTYDAWKAFNGTVTDDNDCWATVNGTITGWIKIDFGSSTKIRAVSIQCRTMLTTTSSMNTFILYGSNDNIIFEELKTVANQNYWSPTETRIFKLSESVTFRYYRINIVSNNGSTIYSDIGDIKFWQDTDEGTVTYITNKEASETRMLPKNTTLNMKQRQNDPREGLLGFANDSANYGTLWMINDKGNAQVARAAMADGDVIFEGSATSGNLTKAISNYKYILVSMNGQLKLSMPINTKDIPGTFGFSIYALTSANVYAAVNFTSTNTFSITDARISGWTVPFTVTRIIGIL